MKRKLLLIAVALMCSVGVWAQIDVTSYLTNPSFETGDMTGWTSYGYNPEGGVGVVDVSGVSRPVADYPLTNSDGTYICDFSKEQWTGWWSYYTLSQTVTLPAGSYRLTAVLSSKAERIVSLYATTTAIETSKGSAIYTNVTIDNDDEGKTATLNFTSDGTTPTILGAGLITGDEGYDGYKSFYPIYFRADNFKLYLISTTDYYDYSSKINQSSWKFDEDDGSGTTTAPTTNVNQGDYTGSHIERYRGASGHYGKKLYQTITDLPAGVYKVKASCMTAAANGVEGDYALADNTKYNAYFYANNNALTYPLKNATSSYRDNYVYLSEGGSIEFGVKTVAVGANWSAIANASLELISKDYSHYQHIMLPRLLEELEGLRTYASSYGPIQKSAKATLQGVLSTYADVDETDIDAVSTAVAALQTAIGNAVNNHKTYVSTLYAPYQRLISTQVSPKSATLTTLSEHYNASAYDTFEELIADYQAIEIENLGTTTGAFTSVIINNSFELDGTATNSPTGWDIPNKGNDYGARTLGSSGSTYYMTNADGSYVFNNWQNWWMTCDLSQTITGLPNGEYVLSAVIAGYASAYTDLTANDESTTCATTGAGIGETETTVTTFVTDGTLIIGANNIGMYYKSGSNWQTFLKVDNFTLTYNGIKPMLKELIDEAQAIVDAEANVGPGVFQISTTAPSTLSSVITTANGVYEDGSASFDAVQDAIDDLNEAISTYYRTINAPADGKKYYIKVATSGHAKENNAWLTFFSAIETNNPTGYKIQANNAPKDYLAQAYTLTQVSGNTYNISIALPEGEVYLTYGSLNDSPAGWATSQIQATTNSSKKGTFEIVATNTANVFNIVNTETSSTIACQTGGNIYTESGNADFTVEEASQASVTVSAKAGKYGTVIFPFTPDVSTGFDGIKFYSCTDVNNETNNLVLTEEVSPAANTPYIIKNTNRSENFTKDLSGWGTANQDSYATELLTGVYTAATIPASASNYVLQTHDDGVQAFYSVDAAFTATPYKAFLTHSGGSVKAFGFDIFDAINAIEAAENEKTEIYNLAGQRLNKAQKGINIINGKKVLVK